jgi:hypothetical protein
VLELVYTYAELTSKRGQSTKAAAHEFLEFAPIMDHSGNKIKQVTTEDIVSFVTENGNYIDKYASSYLFNKSQATDYGQLLNLAGAVVNTKSKKTINTNDMDKGKNYLNLGKKKLSTKQQKELTEQIIEKAKLITKKIPAYVLFVDHVKSTRQLMKTDKRMFEQQFGIPLSMFKDMVESRFIKEDLLDRLIVGLKEVA